jgi:hypothetical protein
LLLTWDLSQIKDLGLNNFDWITGITKNSKCLTTQGLHKNLHAALFPTSVNVLFNNFWYDELDGGIGFLDIGFNLVVIQLFEEITNP